MRALAQELRELVLPPLGLRGRAVTGGLRAARGEEHAAVLHALDLALHDAELGRGALVISRRMIQLRPDISTGCEAIGTAICIMRGCFCAQIQVSMPPIELPTRRRRRFTPRCSVTRRWCASTMSS